MESGDVTRIHTSRTDFTFNLASWVTCLWLRFVILGVQDGGAGAMFLVYIIYVGIYELS
jgi:hypothetical protein